MSNKNLFNSIKLIKPKKNVFDLTHDVKLSLKMGDLVPILALECVPGDTFKLSCDSLLRFQPLIAPVMHRMDVTMHYFFVPNRLVWDGWEDFITNVDSNRVHPVIPTSGEAATTIKLMDYMGIPSWDGANVSNINALPFAAYQMIYNEYYRDQNLITQVQYKLADGNNSFPDLLTLRKRAWTHDYFTSALPWAQKGATVDIPLGDISTGNLEIGYTNYIGGTEIINDDAGNEYPLPRVGGSGTRQLVTENAELNVNPTSINDLRRAFRLQEWLEKNARAGTRYVESILAHFGVKSSDARLNRPEYITGTKSPVVISEVLNNTGEDGGLPQGNMAGHGMSVTSGKYGKYFCEEHGFIIGVMSVLPLPAYQQGIEKKYIKTDKFDYFFPEFAHIGEQEVLNKELYAGHHTPNGTFGYVPRYSEYKYVPSRVCGDLRTSLNYWHLGRIFETSPNLNKDFIEANPSKRIFAVEDPNVDPLICHVLNKIQAIRPMPKFGTPSF